MGGFRQQSVLTITSVARKILGKVDLTLYLGRVEYICKVNFTYSMEDMVYNRVAFLRQRQGMTQEELANSVAVTRQTIIALEKGNYTPSVLLALKIAKVFKVELEKVFNTHSFN